MLTVELEEAKGIAILEPHGELAEEDFKNITQVIDKYIEKHKQLHGLIIYTKSFPGWDSFKALTSHLKFVRDHHKKVSFVAISTDSVIGNLAETIANHFTNAEIKKFSFQQLEQAKEWIENKKVTGDA